MANYCKVYLIPLHLELQTLKFIVNIKKHSKKVTLSISWASVKYPVGLKSTPPPNNKFIEVCLHIIKKAIPQN